MSLLRRDDTRNAREQQNMESIIICEEPSAIVAKSEGRAKRSRGKFTRYFPYFVGTALTAVLDDLRSSIVYRVRRTKPPKEGNFVNNVSAFLVYSWLYRYA